MAFNIEVKKRGKDEEFGFEDLEMFHQECYGGKIKVKPEFSAKRETVNEWLLQCERCKYSTMLAHLREEESIWHFI